MFEIAGRGGQFLAVIPAKAGISRTKIPAFSGMTKMSAEESLRNRLRSRLQFLLRGEPGFLGLSQLLRYPAKILL